MVLFCSFFLYPSKSWKFWNLEFLKNFWSLTPVLSWGVGLSFFLKILKLIEFWKFGKIEWSWLNCGCLWTLSKFIDFWMFGAIFEVDWIPDVWRTFSKLIEFWLFGRLYREPPQMVSFSMVLLNPLIWGHFWGFSYTSPNGTVLEGSVIPL